MGDVEVPDVCGLILVFERFDSYANAHKSDAQILLDILDSHSRDRMLYGQRMITIIQSADADITFEPIGASGVNQHEEAWGKPGRDVPGFRSNIFYTPEELYVLEERARYHVTSGSGRNPEFENKPLSDEELDRLVRALDETTDDDWQRRTALLRVIRFADAIPPQRSLPLLEQMLRGERPGAVYDAVWILCANWAMTGNYSAELQRLIRNELPDEGFARELAIQQAGEWLYDRTDVGLLRALLDRYEQLIGQDTRAARNMQDDMVNALANAVAVADAPEEEILRLARARLAELEQAQQDAPAE